MSQGGAPTPYDPIVSRWTAAVAEVERLTAALAAAEQRADASDREIERLNRFLDFTVREWLYDDEHSDCDGSCVHKVAKDIQYRTLEDALSPAYVKAAEKGSDDAT